MIAAFALAAALTAADRGGQLAAVECSTCHAISLGDASLHGDAPPFRDLRLRFNPISLEQRLEALPKAGHPPMPMRPLSQKEVADLVAYIQTLTRQPPP